MEKRRVQRAERLMSGIIDGSEFVRVLDEFRLSWFTVFDRRRGLYMYDRE